MIRSRNYEIATLSNFFLLWIQCTSGESDKHLSWRCNDGFVLVLKLFLLLFYPRRLDSGLWVVYKNGFTQRLWFWGFLAPWAPGPDLGYLFLCVCCPLVSNSKKFTSIQHKIIHNIHHFQFSLLSCKLRSCEVTRTRLVRKSKNKQEVIRNHF